MERKLYLNKIQKVIKDIRGTVINENKKIQKKLLNIY